MILYIVSLRRSTTRRKTVLQNPFGKVGYEFFDAFDASRGEHEGVSRYDEKGALQHFGLPLTPGEVACYASHYHLWEKCRSSGLPIAVMEDDVAISTRFEAAFELAKTVVVEHRFIRLAAQHDRPFRIIRSLDASHRLIRFLQGPAGTQCYCLSPDGAAALLDGASRWIEPVDVYIDSFWRHTVTPKAIIPFEAREMDRSIVESTIGNRKFHRAGWAKLRREATRARDAIARIVFNATHPDTF